MLQQTRRRVCLLTLHTILFLLPSSSRAFSASLWAAGRCKRISSVSQRLGPLPLSSRAISMQSSLGSSSLELVDRLRGAASLHEFLREVKAASSPLLSSSSSSSSCTSQKLLLCMGNEAADLDSIVCAVAFALLCQVGLVDSLAPLRSSLCLPVLNIPQQDFALRQDAELLFRELRVSPALLSFMPDLSEVSSSSSPSSSPAHELVGNAAAAAARGATQRRASGPQGAKAGAEVAGAGR